MRGVHTFVNDIRRSVFTEIARLAYEGGDYSRIASLPFKIIPGEVAAHRENIFLERAIVAERLRLAIGLPLRPVSEHAPVSEGIIESAIASKYYDPPLVNIISFACNACPTKQVRVTDACQGCIAHPCREVVRRFGLPITPGDRNAEPRARRLWPRHSCNCARVRWRPGGRAGPWRRDHLSAGWFRFRYLVVRPATFDARDDGDGRLEPAVADVEVSVLLRSRLWFESLRPACPPSSKKPFRRLLNRQRSRSFPGRGWWRGSPYPPEHVQ